MLDTDFSSQKANQALPFNARRRNCAAGEIGRCVSRREVLAGCAKRSKKHRTIMKVPGLRSDYEQVGGVVYFGRMLDKIRLKSAGRLPAGYFTGTANRTHFDSRCCRFLSVQYEELHARVLEGGSDEEILAWCFDRGVRPSNDQIEVWNEFMRKRGWRDAGSDEFAQAKNERGFGARDDIQTWFDLHLAEEA